MWERWLLHLRLHHAQDCRRCKNLTYLVASNELGDAEEILTNSDTDVDEDLLSKSDSDSDSCSNSNPPATHRAAIRRLRRQVHKAERFSVVKCIEVIADVEEAKNVNALLDCGSEINMITRH